VTIDSLSFGFTSHGDQIKRWKVPKQKKQFIFATDAGPAKKIKKRQLSRRQKVRKQKKIQKAIAFSESFSQRQKE